MAHEQCNRVTYGPDCKPDRRACPNRYKNPPPEPCVRCGTPVPFRYAGHCGVCLRDPATYNESVESEDT